jgi:DNA-directed RNA polymerase subunit beta'
MKTMASSEGEVKYFKLEGDYLADIDVKEGEEVNYKGLFALIIDANKRESERHYIVRGSKIVAKPNSIVKKGDVISEPLKEEEKIIAEWDPFANPILAEDNGIVHFEDIIAVSYTHLTLPTIA